MENLFKVITSDGEEFNIKGEVLEYALTIGTMIEVLDDTDEEPIELPNIDSEIFKIIVDWISRYISDPPASVPPENDYSTEFHTTWEDEFFRDISQVTLFNLILASSYLDVRNLSIATFKLVARLINNAGTVTALRETFGIENDFLDGEQNCGTVEAETQRLLRHVEEANIGERSEDMELEETQANYDPGNAEFQDEDEGVIEPEWDTEEEVIVDDDDDDSDIDEMYSDSDYEERIEEEEEERDPIVEEIMQVELDGENV